MKLGSVDQQPRVCGPRPEIYFRPLCQSTGDFFFLLKFSEASLRIRENYCQESGLDERFQSELRLNLISVPLKGHDCFFGGNRCVRKGLIQLSVIANSKSCELRFSIWEETLTQDSKGVQIVK